MDAVTCVQAGYRGGASVSTLSAFKAVGLGDELRLELGTGVGGVPGGGDVV